MRLCSLEESAADDDKIDMFLIEADYALKYVDSPYTLDVRADIGLTDDELAGQYKYTQDIATADGVLKGVTWQATPGLFAYRRSIAKDVLGTDDPAEVQTYLSDWDKFNEVAGEGRRKGLQDALRLRRQLPHLLQQRFRSVGGRHDRQG